MLHMEQKDYKMEVLNVLVKRKSHGREIAKLVGTNHMKVMRKLSELQRENVVDCEIEGKNKVYFLKESEEAKQYLYVAEHYKLIRAINSYPILRKVVEKIGKCDVGLAVLSGPYAKGIANSKSDIDVFLETEDKALKKELEDSFSKLSVKIGRLDEGELANEIKENHVILKGVEEYYEKF